ncbi:RNA polymerase Rbp10 [Cellulosilyticum lentocellum]|uniref:RNA polymerase Rbp10 n=1 Tax=Cellulosilyticum lentocellum (strain ATCC 49066 / DSM 5427 / NCIMB 11756 / RHM5) TaxID=642492 RepID=F2JPH4_CELLD|nr:RNA polymerase Rbp10 [Cellulosilyticum lentocellum]ADZ82522.1 RNA polymerase Rbp10 [Cellulosilyticum lentocellum DSM 5427]
MIKEKRIPCFANVCEKCGEVVVLPKQDKVPSYCHICGHKALYKEGWITKPFLKAEAVTVNSVADIEKVLYKQVELLAENSKECEPEVLVMITECINEVFKTILG